MTTSRSRAKGLEAELIEEFESRWGRLSAENKRRKPPSSCAWNCGRDDPSGATSSHLRANVRIHTKVERSKVASLCISFQVPATDKISSLAPCKTSISGSNPDGASNFSVHSGDIGNTPCGLDRVPRCVTAAVRTTHLSLDEGTDDRRGRALKAGLRVFGAILVHGADSLRWRNWPQLRPC